MGNFFGDFSRGLSSGVDIGTQMAANQRAQEEFDQKKAEYARLQQERLAAQAAGNTVDNPNDTTGLLTPDQYTAMSAPKKGKKAGALPAVTGPALTPTTPTAPPAATPPVTTPPPQVVPAAPAPGIPVAPPATTAPPPAAMPAPTTPPAAAPGPSPTPAAPPSDYLPVLVNGNVMYAPSKRVKQLSGPDRVYAQAAAVGQFDPTIGAQLQQSAQAIEKGNIELTTTRYSQAVMAAQRVATVDPARGLSMLKDTFSSLPGLGKSDFTMDKDGSITVNHYVTTEHGDQLFSTEKVPAVDKETGLSATDTLFRRAQALANPDAFRQYTIDNADLASKITTSLYTKALTSLTQANAAEVHPNAVSQRGLEGAQAEYYGTQGRKDVAETAYSTGIDIRAPFSDNVPSIMQSEGTAQAKGFDTILGDRPDGTNALGVKPPKPPTQMTLGEVYDFQRKVLLKKSGSMDSTAMGGLQITSQNVATYGPKLYGANWRNTKFTPDTQIALGAAIHKDQGYGAWPSLGSAGAGTSPGGLPLSPKDQAARGSKRQAQMAQYVAQWMTQNNSATPGTPEYTQNLMSAQTQAMQIYGGMDASAAPAVDFTTKPAAPASRAQAPAQPASATVKLPPPKQALSPTGQQSQVQAASTALEADIRRRMGTRGPLQQAPAAAQFQRDYGMTIPQARANPVAAVEALRQRQAADQNAARQREIRQRALLR